MLPLPERRVGHAPQQGRPLRQGADVSPIYFLGLGAEEVILAERGEPRVQLVELVSLFEVSVSGFVVGHFWFHLFSCTPPLQPTGDVSPRVISNVLKPLNHCPP